MCVCVCYVLYVCVEDVATLTPTAPASLKFPFSAKDELPWGLEASGLPGIVWRT